MIFVNKLMRSFEIEFIFVKQISNQTCILATFTCVLATFTCVLATFTCVFNHIGSIKKNQTSIIPPNSL